MRLPSVRFTVRRLMLAVAVTVTVLPFAAGTVWVLSPEQVRLRALIRAYESRAAHHAELENEYGRLSEFSDRSHAIAIRGGELVHIPNGQDPALVPKYVELARYDRAKSGSRPGSHFNPGARETRWPRLTMDALRTGAWRWPAPPSCRSRAIGLRRRTAEAIP
jgi:hypothetical protein